MSERLRERKKRRTKAALIETAYRLFDSQGYERTTTAEIAAAAEVSVATLYNHFPSKERLLFTDDGPRLLEAGLAVIQQGSTPSEALRAAMDRILDEVTSSLRDPAGELEVIRLRLVTTVPALRATLLERIFDTQDRLARALREAYPDELDEIDAAAMVGAVIGSALAAGLVALREGRPLDEAMRRAIDASLR